MSAIVFSAAVALAPFSSIETSRWDPVTLSQLDGLAWVKMCENTYPEIQKLASAEVRYTQEGHANQKDPYSVQLYGQKFMEFDRTVMTLHCLRSFLDGSQIAYQEFIRDQKETDKLSWEQFSALHDEGLRLIHSQWQGLSAEQMRLVMEAALVLGDLGKSEVMRKEFSQITSPDHDDFYGELMAQLEKDPSLLPSFARLSKEAQSLLISTANLAHFGHITHLEGGLNMFTGLVQSKIAYQDPVALDIALFVHTCDVAGALGHVNNRSSLVYTAPAHRAMMAMKESVRVLKDPTKTEQDAYRHYAQERADWLGLDPEDALLGRVGAMMRLFTSEQGKALKGAFASLDSALQEQIEVVLNPRLVDETMRTPTYMPAVLVNLMNNAELGKTEQERLGKTVEIGLPFLVRVLQMHHTLLQEKKIDAAIPLCFNSAAGVAKQSPQLLAGPFYIDEKGEVLVGSTP